MSYPEVSPNVSPYVCGCGRQAGGGVRARVRGETYIQSVCVFVSTLHAYDTTYIQTDRQSVYYRSVGAVRCGAVRCGNGAVGRAGRALPGTIPGPYR
jgi:hypothetical protein